MKRTVSPRPSRIRTINYRTGRINASKRGEKKKKKTEKKKEKEKEERKKGKKINR